METKKLFSKIFFSLNVQNSFFFLYSYLMHKYIFYQIIILHYFSDRATNHTPQKNFTGKVIAASHWCMTGSLGRFKEVKVKEASAGQPRGGCPPQEDGHPVETHHALLFSTPLHFLNKGRKQGQARVVQPSAELFDRMQCSAGKPRQSVSRRSLSDQYSTVPDFQISICGTRSLFLIFAFRSFIFMSLMQYLWCSFHLMIWSAEILLVETKPCAFISCVTTEIWGSTPILKHAAV